MGITVFPGGQSATNKIYVANVCGNDPSCSSAGTVTVIDANHNYSTSTVTVGSRSGSCRRKRDHRLNLCGQRHLFRLPVLSQRRDGYLDNGTNNATQTINVGVNPYYLAVNAVTNKIFVSNDCGNDINCASLGTVTVIDGLTNNTSTVNVGSTRRPSASTR